MWMNHWLSIQPLENSREQLLSIMPKEKNNVLSIFGEEHEIQWYLHVTWGSCNYTFLGSYSSRPNNVCQAMDAGVDQKLCNYFHLLAKHLQHCDHHTFLMRLFNITEKEPYNKTVRNVLFVAGWQFHWKLITTCTQIRSPHTTTTPSLSNTHYKTIFF